MAAEKVRQEMTKFWEQYEPTLESMMLSEDARKLDRDEREEILSYLPSVEGKQVLELGSGIGRFTGYLASHCEKLTTVDFIEQYVERNKQLNSGAGNVDFICADVTKLDLEADSRDVIFSNWLLMYLSDEEVSSLTRRMLTWLKDGGYLFVRESCFHPSGDIKIGQNPTFYRSPCQYFSLLQKEVGGHSECDSGSVFQLLTANSVFAYVKAKGNPNQLCFLLQKMPGSGENYDSFQAFLDENQYTRSGILRYERIFGPTYVSTGGAKTTEEFCRELNLKAGETVLDVGCGIGGSAFHMATCYGVDVRGVDLSTNMISIALENQARQPMDVKTKVCFQITDITKQDYDDESFDVIYSRDTLLHIGDKDTLFANFYRWLKPGGRLLISDYARGDQEHSEKFLSYVAQRGYHLLTVAEYGETLSRAGFCDVQARDMTGYFIQVLRDELESFEQDKQQFIQEFSSDDYDHIESGWRDKIERCGDGDQAWGLFIAAK